MLATVMGVDITPLIDEKTYKMNAEETFESWLDGNYVEHRIYTRSKIRGSFTVSLYGQKVSNRVMTTQAFMDMWELAVSKNVVTMGVFVQNKNRVEAIEAYYTFDGKFHREMVNGNYIDKITVTLVER